MTFKTSKVTESTDYVQLEEPVYWNADKTKLVPKDHPDAAHAYGGVSTRVLIEQAKQDGLIPADKKDQPAVNEGDEGKPAAKSGKAKPKASKSK